MIDQPSEIIYEKLKKLLKSIQDDMPLTHLLKECSSEVLGAPTEIAIGLVEYDLNDKAIHRYFCECGGNVTVTIFDANSSQLMDFKKKFASNLVIQPDHPLASSVRYLLGKHYRGQLLHSYPIVNRYNENFGNIFFLLLQPLAPSTNLLIEFVVKVLSIAVIKQLTSMRFEDEHIKLISASKKAALGDMAGGIAHEINNPLSVISGQVQKIKLLDQMHKLTANELSSSLDKILSTIERIDHIVTALRAFSRDDTQVTKQVHDLNNILEDSLALCAEKIRKYGVQIKIERKTNRTKIYCNPVQISQVIINLMSNAFDAIVNFEAPWIRIQIDHEGNSVILKITDSGLGIPKEIRDHIMEPFFTTKEVGQGTGIGLSLSQGIVQSHGGVFYYNEEACNTEFIMTLPLVAENTAS